VAGFQARAALKNLFSELPDAEKQLVSEGATSILWFEHPAERFLLVTDAATAERVTEALRGEAQLNNSQQWLALNIEAGCRSLTLQTARSLFLRQRTCRRWAASALKRLLHRPGDGRACEIPRANKRAVDAGGTCQPRP
jgi:hypothetical protein